MAHPHDTHATKKLTLPSGKSIEVVVFDDDAVDLPTRPAAPMSTPAHDLHVCPRCDSELVHPTDWEEHDADRWQLDLRCPNCEWEDNGLFDRSPVEDLDEQLERGTEALLRDLRHLTRANMKDEVERFVAALEADGILPMDF